MLCIKKRSLNLNIYKIPSYHRVHPNILHNWVLFISTSSIWYLTDGGEGANSFILSIPSLQIFIPSPQTSLCIFHLSLRENLESTAREALVRKLTEEYAELYSKHIPLPLPQPPLLLRTTSSQTSRSLQSAESCGLFPPFLPSSS